MDVSVIIVNYKTAPLIVDAIRSVFEKTEGLDYEVIVVDNASGDNSRQLLETEFGKRVAYLPLPENVGFGRANNAGFAIARGRNLLCLNPDTILMNNAVKILSDYLDSHPQAGVAGANLYSQALKPAYSYHLFPVTVWTGELNTMTFGLFTKPIRSYSFNHSGHPKEIRGSISGASMMIPRKIVEQYGGFDPDFFMYCEDTEFCTRIRRKGYRLVSVPGARIMHLEGESTKDAKEHQVRFSARGRRLFYRKAYGNGYLQMADIAWLAGMHFRSLVFALTGKRTRLNNNRRAIKIFREVKAQDTPTNVQQP